MIEDREKPFLEHLADLRVTLLKCAAAVAVGMALSAAFLKPILDFLRAPLAQVLTERGLSEQDFLITLEVTDPFNIIIQVALVSGLMISFPFILFFLGQFILPALHPPERRLLVPGALAAGFLFLAGVAFCYTLVLPPTLAISMDLNTWIGSSAQWTIQKYFSFTVHFMLASGLSFELPLVLMILARLGLVSRAFLADHRRHAFVLLLVIAACVTPGSDPYTLVLVFAPLYFLYEISILGASWIERRRAADLP